MECRDQRKAYQIGADDETISVSFDTGFDMEDGLAGKGRWAAGRGHFQELGGS